MLNELRIAFSLLTTLPVGDAHWTDGCTGRSAKWFPVVGLVIGALLYATAWALRLVLSPLVTVVLVQIIWVAITGGLHLDGLTDCGDGLLATVSRERRLEIMKDPRVGAFGAISLGLFMLLKFACIASLPASPGGMLALVAAPVVGRYCAILIGRLPSARPGGMGADFRLGITPRVVMTATVIPVVVVGLCGPKAWIGALGALFVCWYVARTAQKRLGGVTGDVQGLSVELAEAAVLIAYCARI